MKILVACEESQAVTKELKEKEVNEKMSETIVQRIEQEQIIDAKYEHLAAEYARISGSMEYMLAIKQFDDELYKSNKVHIDNELERLDIESERLLTELENAVNNKEPV